jgi:L-threonylcarbamoyladenylate synthase
VSAVIGTDLARAAELLRAGRLVAIPTETVYGLAANALSPEAVVRIFEAKDRPFFDPLIVHVASLMQAESLVMEFPPLARQLAERFWPGPLTLVLPKREHVPDLVTAGSALVAVRVPDHPLTLELLGMLDFPLAAPSANPFGRISPTTPQHVLDGLGDRVDYILDGGPSAVGVESTIVGVERSATGEEELVIYRWGGLDLETLLEATPCVWRMAGRPQDAAPGNLPSHYAPRTPLVLGPPEEEVEPSRTGVIVFTDGDWPETRGWGYQRVLAPDGELSTAARNLFGVMRELDAEGEARELDVIYAALVPDIGLGRAINDRLRRAAAEQR